MKSKPQIYESMMDIFEWEHDHCLKHVCIDMCEERSRIYIRTCIDCVYGELSHIHVCIMIYIEREHKADKTQDYKNLLLCEVQTHYTLKSIRID